MTTRLIRLRYAARCAECDTELAPRTEAWWDGDEKRAMCVSCHGEATAAPPSASLAGGSAQREFDRRVGKREQRVRAKHPRIGGLLLALSDEPQSTRAWARGAEGERRLGKFLDDVSNVRTLHDRPILKSRANIDHLVVAPTGVYVVDAKRYTGQVAKRDVGGWFTTDMRLFVGQRDCTKLVAGMAKQVDAVRSALIDEWPDVPIRPVLCFVDAEWGLFSRPFELSGVLVTWPKDLRQRLCVEDERIVGEVDVVAQRLAAALPAAS